MAKKGILVSAILLIILCLCYRPILKRLYPVQNKETVEYYSQEYNIDPLLVYSVIRAESKFNPYAVSSKGAIGLMQITPSTGEYLANLLGEKDVDSDKLYDQNLNIRLGSYYLSKLMEDFDGKLELALAAYNGGEGNVRKWLENYSGEGSFKINDIPFDETRNYVKKVKRNYSIYKYLYGDM